MFVDVDGAPNAYGPPGKPSLDFERKRSPRWPDSPSKTVGYLTERDRRTPVVQGPNGPETRLLRLHHRLPRRRCRAPLGWSWTTATRASTSTPQRFNYVVLGSIRQAPPRCKLGDLRRCAFSFGTHRTVYAIVGDSGNAIRLRRLPRPVAIAWLPLQRRQGRRRRRAGDRDPLLSLARTLSISFFHTQAEIDHAAEALTPRTANSRPHREHLFRFPQPWCS